MNDDPNPRRGIDPALIVILAGVSAALHVGKLPPALPVLREALSLSLVEAGFLLSLVQLAGMTLGLTVGLAADSLGLRRCMVGGLVTLSAASALGGFAHDAASLLVLRAVEGLGLLLAVTPAPSLIRRLPSRRSNDVMLGLWGAYMPFGTAAALLLVAWLLHPIGWQAAWWLLALPSFVMAAWLLIAVPPDGKGAAAQPAAWIDRLRRTLASRGPWLLALTFAVYSGQWLTVIGFLPSIYVQAAVAGEVAGALTALAAAANIVGNVASGRLLQRGATPHVLLYCGFAAMAVGAAVAFVPALHAGPGLKYAAVLAFSTIGGLVPGTLFALSVRLAPDGYTVATTVGWMQQFSALGQFTGPPVAAWVANRVGDWHWTWAVTGSLALAGIFFSGRIAVLFRARSHLLQASAR
ncbi:MAG TPA: MFS transporter [Burkholderiaceae bacterium]|nr:MFS transporter [Burkholderiaceae bacterium]